MLAYLPSYLRYFSYRTADLCLKIEATEQYDKINLIPFSSSCGSLKTSSIFFISSVLCETKHSKCFVSLKYQLAIREAIIDYLSLSETRLGYETIGALKLDRQQVWMLYRYQGYQ